MEFLTRNQEAEKRRLRRYQQEIKKKEEMQDVRGKDIRRGCDTED
ncbi:MAG: hypothetical protein QM793_12610 [Muricomes sp.]